MIETSFILLLLISSQIRSQKLTTQENELIRKNCGVHFLGQPIQRSRLVKKSYGGREFEENEYPWTVVLHIGGTWCSGVQISPRHILTAAHCVLDFDIKQSQELCGLNQSHRLVTAKELNLCNLNNDLALIELSQNISESDSTPICMPNDDLQLNPVLYASGIGLDPSAPITFENPIGEYSHGQQVIALRYHAVDQILHLIQTKTFGKGLCPGDSGGPLFQVDDEGRNVLVGIDSGKIGSCYQHSRNMVDRFTDVRANLDWICKYSGVCQEEGDTLFELRLQPLMN